MKIKGNYIFSLFLFLYFIFGFYLSINTGITTDEIENLYSWTLNLAAIKDFFGFNDFGYTNLNDYIWRYKGVGFYYFSHIYILLADLIIKLENFPEIISKVLLNHGLIFFTFFLSAIFAKKIINLIIKDRFYSNVFLLFYLSYPYLIGHGFFNTTDTPFLFAWILSTYISAKIFIKAYNKENISFLSIFLLALSTSFLLSIRISGILIFLQYLIFLTITLKSINESFHKLIKLYLSKISFFIFCTFIFTFLFYPLFWKNPLLILDSINYLRNIQYGVCTLTLGTCMDALNLPSSYILIWLLFKLPLLSLMGFSLFPFVEKKIFSTDLNQIMLGSIFLTIISIIFLLIFFDVNLYDELRHILYLIPLILIVTFSIIYFFSRKLLLFLSIASIFIFTIQNFNMYPYQYTWFNLFSNFIDVNKNFEIDYWGVSGRNIAKKINNNKNLLLHKNECIYVSPKHVIEPFIDSEYKCIKPFLSIYPKSSEKYILVKYMRNIRRENPDNCEFIFEESYNLNLFNNRLKLGEVYLCN